MGANRSAGAVTLILFVAGCATAPGPGERSPGPATEGGGAGRAPREAARGLVPPGYGTLRQDEVTLSLREGNLLIKVTPLAESVIRLTAPDTYRRLSGLAASHREELRLRAGETDPTLFLVSFFSYAPNVTYQPEDVQIVNQGIRFRPLAIAPVTPGWGTQRLDQQETEMAIYAFSGDIVLETPLSVEYRLARNDGWERIIPRLEEERAKVRARAGTGPRERPPPGGAPPAGYPSLIPYLRIFR